MSFKKVLLEVNCGGHVSESTFNNFLDIVKHYAEDHMTDSTIIKTGYLFTTTDNREKGGINNGL